MRRLFRALESSKDKQPKLPDPASGDKAGGDKPSYERKRSSLADKRSYSFNVLSVEEKRKSLEEYRLMQQLRTLSIHHSFGPQLSHRLASETGLSSMK